jgi:hypothetical protein
MGFVWGLWVGVGTMGWCGDYGLVWGRALLPVRRAQLGWFSPAAPEPVNLPLPANPPGSARRPGKSARSHISLSHRNLPRCPPMMTSP